jgi:hypothetical protein
MADVILLTGDYNCMSVASNSNIDIWNTNESNDLSNYITENGLIKNFNY